MLREATLTKPGLQHRICEKCGYDEEEEFIDGLGPGSYGGILGEEPGVTPHDLDEEYAVVAGGRIAYLVDAFHDGVERGVVADGRVGAAQVVVDRGGDSDAGQVVLLSKNACAMNRTVATDNDEGIDLLALQVLVCLAPTFFAEEVLAGRRLQDGAALLDDVADVLRLAVHNFAVDESLVPTAYSLDIQAVVDSRACDGANGAVHARSVVSRRHQCNRFYHRTGIYFDM